MNIKKLFDQQKSLIDPITEEMLENMAQKQDYFGADYKIGDYQLFAMFGEEVPDEQREDEELFANSGVMINMAKVCEDSYDEIDKNYVYMETTQTGNVDIPRFFNRDLLSEDEQQIRDEQNKSEK